MKVLLVRDMGAVFVISSLKLAEQLVFYTSSVSWLDVVPCTATLEGCLKGPLGFFLSTIDPAGISVLD